MNQQAIIQLPTSLIEAARLFVVEAKLALTFGETTNETNTPNADQIYKYTCSVEAGPTGTRIVAIRELVPRPQEEDTQEETNQQQSES